MASADTEKLTAPSVVRRLLEERGLQPQKRWGQHFLCDENVLRKILEAAELTPEDRVFEVGPGLGVLTERLAQVAWEVVAVEIDRRLIPVLEERLRPFRNVRLVWGDVLQVPWEELLPLEGDEREHRWKALGNLPYGITSPLLERLIEHRERFSLAVWMVQLEVAEKIAAPLGTRGASALGAWVQAFCAVEVLFRVSRNAFWPRPDVDSAVVRLRLLDRPRLTASAESYRKAVRVAFGWRRKTLLKALTLAPELRLPREAAKSLLERAGIEGHRRGETLTLEELDRLARELEGEREERPRSRA